MFKLEMISVTIMLGLLSTLIIGCPNGGNGGYTPQQIDNFVLSNLVITPGEVTPNGEITVKVTVTNTGNA